MTTTLAVPDSPKMLRETLAMACTALQRHDGMDVLNAVHVDRIRRLIHECDRHRPLGPDGKHGQRHTPTCGCEDMPERYRPQHAVDLASIRAGDTVTLVRDEHLARDVVERIDVYPTPQGGYSIVLRERTQAYLTSAGWLVTEHISALPTLIPGHRYVIDTSDREGIVAKWEPIDGIRANHPWLVPGSDGTRYRTDYVTTYRTIEDPK